LPVMLQLPRAAEPAEPLPAPEGKPGSETRNQTVVLMGLASLLAPRMHWVSPPQVIATTPDTTCVPPARSNRDANVSSVPLQRDSSRLHGEGSHIILIILM